MSFFVEGTTPNAIFTGIIYVFLLSNFISVVCSIFDIVARWIIFGHIRVHRWLAFVPLARDYALYLFAWGNGILYVSALGLYVLSAICFFLPVTFHILTIFFGFLIFLISLATKLRISHRFGHGFGYFLFLVLAEPVALLMLALQGIPYRPDGYDGYSKKYPRW